MGWFPGFGLCGKGQAALTVARGQSDKKDGWSREGGGGLEHRGKRERARCFRKEKHENEG